MYQDWFQIFFFFQSIAYRDGSTSTLLGQVTSLKVQISRWEGLTGITWTMCPPVGPYSARGIIPERKIMGCNQRPMVPVMGTMNHRQVVGITE